MLKRALFLIVVVAGCKSDKPDVASPEKPADPTPTAVAPSTAPKPALPPVDDSKATTTDERPHLHRRDRDAMTDDERKAARHARAENLRTRLDTNGDGKLTPDELAAATGRMHFDDPKALDTNGDGVISTEELEAGMAARREQRRAARHAADGGSGSAAPADDGTP